LCSGRWRAGEVALPEDKKEQAEREIWEGESEMELGYNTVKAKMGPQRVKHHVPGV